MKIRLLATVAALVSMVVCANAQVQVAWWNEETSPGSFVYKAAIDPISGLVVMSSSADPLAGALFQLIEAAGAAPSAPTIADFGIGTGLTGGDALNSFAWAGKDDYGAGVIYELAGAFSGTKQLYVRIWDRPTSGSGNMPNSFDYGGGLVGAYYYDTAVESFTGVSGSPSAADLDFTPPTQNDWTFLAIPEPTSVALGLLGLGVIVIRRRLMRK